LINVAPYLDCHAVRVRLTINDEQIMLEIQDNGTGFSLPRDLRSQTQLGHFGIAGMSERAEAVGGKLLVATLPGKAYSYPGTHPLEPLQSELNARR
jgi:signal transduction histidine kinase